MKKRSVSIIALVAASLLLFTACGQPKQDQQGSTPPPSASDDNKKDDKKEEEAKDEAKDLPLVDSDEFLKNFTQENKKVQSVHLTLRGDYDFYGNRSSISIEGFYEYDTATRENTAYHAAQLVQTTENSTSSEVVYVKPGPAFARNSAKGWTQVPLEQEQIDYDGLVAVLQKVLEKDRFELREGTRGNYEVFVNDRDFDLIGTFQGELNYSLEGVDQKDVDKEVLFLVDRETHFLKEISISMKHEHANGKKLNTETRITFDDHNKVAKDAITMVFKEANQ
ncbi:MAG: hypothetical protein Q4A75_03970 [Peptostreptococcaceae bacterium]|nr:hypothetical protein [Peptostreptococcaceae bacterium]